MRREHGISATTFDGWKSKYGEIDVREAPWQKAMEDENHRLKLMVSELRRMGEALKAVIRKAVGACSTQAENLEVDEHYNFRPNILNGFNS